VRPTFADLHSRLGDGFKVFHGENLVGTWTLRSCERLEKPPLPELDELDCFWLCFDTERPAPQAIYLLKHASGYEVTVFAVPYMEGTMQITIN